MCYSVWRASLARDANLGPGRGFIQGNTEVQVAVLRSADPDIELAKLREVVAEAAARWTPTAPELGRMPPAVDLADLTDQPAGWRLPFAIGDNQVLPVALDLSEGHALVSGPPRSGRSTVLATLAEVSQRLASGPAVVLFTGRSSPALSAVRWDVGPVDAGDSAALIAGVKAVDDLLAAGRSVLCLCDDADSYPESASAALEELSKRWRDQPIRFVSAADNRWAQRAYSGLVPELKKAKQGVLLMPDLDLDGDLLGVRLRAPLEPMLSPGRGFLVGRGLSELVQVARSSKISAVRVTQRDGMGEHESGQSLAADWNEMK